MRRTSLLALVLAGFGTTLAGAQPLELEYPTATLDRWMYPFNSTPGTRAIASIFFSGGEPMFDDRDAQFIVGFDTDGEVTPGLDPAEYQVWHARLTVYIDNDNEFLYDPSVDDVTTYLPEGDPGATPDSDVGRPIEVFGLGYRDGFTVQTWLETTYFSLDPLVEETRTAFAAQFDESGVATDVSNQVRDLFNAQSFGIAEMPDLSPGDQVPSGTRVTFDIDVCDPAVLAYIRRALRDGRLNLAVSSLHPAAGGPGGQNGDTTFPIIRTRENGLAQVLGQTPSLELSVRVGSPGNYDGMGVADFSDVLAFLSDFGAGSGRADLAPPCGLDFSDVLAFLIAFGEAVGG